jgi:hypothetical protein
VIICEGLSPWLADYVAMSGGVPCERTFKTVIDALKQDALEDVLQKTASLIRKKGIKKSLALTDKHLEGQQTKPRV